MFAETLRLFGHHPVGFFVAESDGIVAARPGVVQRGLVGAEVDLDSFVGESLPEVDYVADVCEGNRFLVCDRLAYAGDQFVEGVVQFVDPALLMALACGLGVDFGYDGNHARDVAGLGLGARHASESGGDEEHPACRSAAAGETFACGVHHRDGRSVHYALGAYVHVGSGGHLAVL